MASSRTVSSSVSLTGVSPSMICSKCNKPLGTNDCVLLMAADYTAIIHVECFRCLNCDKPLTGGFGVASGSIYCGTCCSGMYQTCCGDCGAPIRHGDSDAWAPVMAFGNLYHSKCLVCVKCSARIIQKVYVDELRNVYCKEHQPVSASPSPPPPTPTPTAPAPVPAIPLDGKGRQ